MIPKWKQCTIAVLAGLIALASAGPSFAEKMYVSNIIKVTLRTGPGTDHKVVQMLQSGSEVDVLEPGGDWSRVRSSSGREGWILSRFISPDIPSDLKLERLQKQHDRLKEHAAKLETENQTLRQDNQVLSEKLSQTSASLQTISDQYETLKKESADFLAMKSKYQEAQQGLQQQTKRATELHELLLQRNIKIALLGAGILFFGFLVGYSTKKQRRRSSLL